MTVHFTSDCHFHHRRIIEYSNRPFASVEDMNQQMIQRWNKQVKREDTVYHLGDFAFCDIEKIRSILSQLNGTKHFINGNHDKQIKQNRNSLIADGLVKSIKDYDEIYVNNQFIVLFHYPMVTFNKGHHGAWALHGHCHGSVVAPGKQVDVGVDATFITGKAEYRPFSFDEIRKFMDSRDLIKHH